MNTTLTIKNSINSIEQSIDEIIQATKELSEEVLRWKPSEDEWSIMQILSHISEAIPYWLGEIELLLEVPGKEWGRGLQDEDRLAAVSKEKVASITLSDVLKGLAALKPQVEQTLNRLDEKMLEIEAPSRNPHFGTKSISFIIEHLLIEHTNKHLGQIQRNLSKLKK